VEHPLPEPPDAQEPSLELLPALDEPEEESDEDDEPANAGLSEDDRLRTDDPLKLYVRQIGDGRLLTPAFV